jgi:exopolysaccharide biosynthesis protein
MLSSKFPSSKIQDTNKFQFPIINFQISSLFRDLNVSWLLIIVWKLFLVSCIFFIFISPASALKRTETKIADGVRYIHILKGPVGRQFSIHVLKVNLDNRNINVKPAIAQDFIGWLKPVSYIARQNNAIAAINGTFYETQRRPKLPVGIIIIDERIVNKTLLSRTTLGITKGKRIIMGIPKVKGKVLNLENHAQFPIWGINRPRKRNEVVIYTPEYGERTRTNLYGLELSIEDQIVTEMCQGNSIIPQNGYVISLHGWTKGYANRLPLDSTVTIQYNLSEEWSSVEQALTGGPRLIENGGIVVDQSLKREGFRGGILEPNARTAVGIGKHNELLMVVVEGKKYWWGGTSGVTYDQLAHLMRWMDCRDAMGLDGGGTSTMYVDGKVVNKLAEGFERYVSNALIVKVE